MKKVADSQISKLFQRYGATVEKAMLLVVSSHASDSGIYASRASLKDIQKGVHEREDLKPGFR